MDFFDKLFTRQTYTFDLLAQSLRSPSGLLELGLAVLLAAAAFFLAGFANRRLNTLPLYTPLLRHIRQRMLWPLLMLVFAIAALAAYRHADWPALWLQLLVLAARWMVLIRFAVAVIHAALPKSRTSDWVERMSAWILWLVFVVWLSGLEHSLVGFLKSMQFSVGATKLNLYSILSGIVWVAVLMVGALWLARLIGERLSRSRLDANLSMILSKITTTVLVVLSVLIALPLVGIDLTVLSVFSGALGVGLGFGLQKVASNYVSGFIILGDRSIRINDRLTVNGFTGNVVQITSRFVVLRAANGSEALIPNETFMTATVINESYAQAAPAAAASFDVRIAYDADLDAALGILREAAAVPQVAAEPAPEARVSEFVPEGIRLTLAYYPASGVNADDVQSGLMQAVRSRFRERGIAFAGAAMPSEKA
ncbi:membrane protein [Bergeriella denitrificans]|uniref:Membrane protein n=2 Tax=Bergeriella denitrificans TaxID=494 RepID=A0A378UH57_BERDE|nr:membrane protein [Bergeriella denitrificans]